MLVCAASGFTERGEVDSCWRDKEGEGLFENEGVIEESVEEFFVRFSGLSGKLL